MFMYVLSTTFVKVPSKFAKLYKLERKSGRSVAASLRSIYINSHILKERTDQLHFGFATMSLRRENVAEAAGAKMSVSFRGYDINIYPLKNPRCYDLLWKKVDKVHTISEYLYHKALSMGLSPDVPYRKITPAIDTTLFNKKDQDKASLKKIRILTIGRLNWIKDYETAISAMKILKEKGYDIEYKIAGDGPELERLTFAVYQSGLTGSVIFLGKKEHKEISRLMKDSDIYLQTSLQEGFCVSVLEAQASGLLCVVSDADGLRENISDGVTGWIVKRRSPDEFALRIESVLKLPPKKKEEISVNARKRVEEEFLLEDQNLKFKEFFNS